MKTYPKKSFLIQIIILLLGTLPSYSQILVNQSWSQVTSYPNINYDFQKSCKDSKGNIIIVGNTINSTQLENIYIAKYDGKDGTQLWFQELNGLSNLTDFGTGVTTKGEDIFVCGTMYDTSTQVSSMAIIAMDEYGSIQWQTDYQYPDYSGLNIPLAIVTNPSGSVFVTGTCQTDASEHAIVTLQIDNGSIVWTSIYDSIGLYDGAGGLRYTEDAGYGRLFVYGVSGSTVSDWDFVTLKLDLKDGTPINTTRIHNTNALFVKTTDIINDNNQNIYATGTVSAGTNNSDIKVIKLDTALNVIWVKTFDGGSFKNDEATAMKIDSKGNIIITGYATRSDNTKEAWLLKLDKLGNKIWDRRCKSSAANKNAQGKDVDIDNKDNIYTAGKIHNGTDYDFLTQAYDSSGNLKWQRTFKTNYSSSNEAQDIIVDNTSSVFVSGRSKDSVGNWRYSTVRYDQWEKPNDYISDNNGKPLYMNKQLIVKFRKDMINKSFTDNTELQFASLGEVLKTWAYDTLHKRYPSLFNTAIKVEKIYKGLKSTYTTSIARNGDNVPVPDFWASLLIYIPNNAARSAIDWKDTLNARLFPLIEYTNLNYAASLQSSCNPSTNIPDDGYYKLNNQIGLNRPDVGIDVDSAWCLETGKPFVKVGIYDAGIDGRHKDLGGDGSHFFQKSKLWGWDFFNNYDLESAYPNYDSYLSHGTSIAGVIGAIRNNNEGIAGIAGGDYMANPDSSGMGVSLLGMKVANDELAPLSVLLDAYVKGVSYIPNSNFGYGIHITSNSFAIELAETDTVFNNYSYRTGELLELSKVFHYSNRNQVANFVSAGNNVTTILYPANFYGDWVTCVGGSNMLGGTHHKGWTGSDNIWDAFIGAAIDIVAPSETDMTFTTNFGGGYGYTYNGYNHRATSFATPYATGTGALLSSYIDTAISHPRNLSPDDIEHILNRTAIDLDRVGKDDTSGWGRLNAGRALKYVNKSCRKVKHFRHDTSVNDTINFTIDSSSNFAINPKDNNLLPIPLKIKLTERYKAPNGYMYDTIPYYFLVDRFQYFCSINIDSNCKIVDVWTRNSSSSGFGLYDTSTGQKLLKPYEHVEYTFTPPNKLLLEYYIYEWVDSNDITQLNGIIGVPDSTGTGLNQSIIDFTVIEEDTTQRCFDSIPPIIGKITKLENGIGYSLYPNPTTDNTTLEIYSQKKENGYIMLTDLAGSVLKKEDIQTEGMYEKNINLDEYTSGVYFLKINFGLLSRTIKIEKL